MPYQPGPFDVIPAPSIQTYDIREYAFLNRSIVRLVHGSQIRVAQTKKEASFVAISIPDTGFDYLKHLLVTWQPTLNFGWLKPRMRDIKTAVHKSVNETYINVVPAPVNSRRETIYMVATHDDEPLAIESEADWLDAEPPTQDDIKQARKDYRKAMSSKKAAWMMNW